MTLVLTHDDCRYHENHLSLTKSREQILPINLAPELTSPLLLLCPPPFNYLPSEEPVDAIEAHVLVNPSYVPLQVAHFS